MNITTNNKETDKQQADNPKQKVHSMQRTRMGVPRLYSPSV